MNSSAFRILAISSDRSLLRDLSRFLKVFGYDVQQAADQRQADSALNSSRHRFILIDGSSQIDALQATRTATSQDRSQPAYILHFANNPTTAQLTEALEAGADDFLQKPVVYGELLARIRNGARVLEYERRVKNQAVFEPLTGYMSRTGFHDRLRFELDYRARHRNQLGVVILDIDFLDQLNERHGRDAGDAVIKEICTHIDTAAPEGAAISSFDCGRFAILLPGFSSAQTEQWADSMRVTIGKADFDVARSEALKVTLSAAVRTITKNNADTDSPEDLIDGLLTTLRHAKSSGRDFVAVSGQFDDEENAWAELATAGDVFSTTVARDVMTPCTIILDEQSKLGEATKLLTQTHLPEIPVVDADGAYLGVVLKDLLVEEASSSKELSLPLTALLTSDIATYDEDTPFDELMDFFSDNAQSLVVINRGTQPVGVVRRDSLAALSEQVLPTTFRPQVGFSTSSDYLVVERY